MATAPYDTSLRGPDGSLADGPPPAHLRKEFSLPKPLKRAVVYASARGIFDLYLNGRRVSEDYFAPEWTDYDRRIQYRAWEVTDRLRQGDNALGAVLADGWFSGYVAWLKRRCNYGSDRNSLLLQLELEFEDGTKELVVTDDSWRCSAGPLLAADFQMGESYDARRELEGWDSPGYDASAWQPVEPVEAPAAPLVAQVAQPVRATQELEPVAIFQPKPGVWVFDLGQNIAGVARLKVSGPAGTTITLRHAERLNPDSTIYVTNLRTARAIDRYTTKGAAGELWSPRFTFHGFQYVELTGYPGIPDRETITGLVLNSDTPLAGAFQCSHPLVNQLYANIVRSQRGNFISVPTDCPQRDERLGWMGDAQIFIRTATYNMDVAAFFNKWMYDVADAQSPAGVFSEISPRHTLMTAHAGAAGWGDAGVIVPWYVYRVYGDTRIIDRHWAAMERWMEFIQRHNPDLVRRNERGSDYGDWLSIGEETSKELLATAYWAYDAALMAKMAAATGRQAEAARYGELFEGIRAAFQREYLLPDGGIKDETQTACLLALYFDLLPTEQRAACAARLVENIESRGGHLSTGFLGVRQLNPVLSETGHHDLACSLLLTDTFPSWLYPISNGATSIWERWDGWTADKGFQDPGMNSFNHYSLGSVGEWLFSVVAGIDQDPEVPGFRKIVLRPSPGPGLDWAEASYRSICGTIESRWERQGDSLTLEVAIPANTTATLLLPCPEGSEVTEGDLPAAQAPGVTLLGREGRPREIRAGLGKLPFPVRGTPVILVSCSLERVMNSEHPGSGIGKNTTPCFPLC